MIKVLLIYTLRTNCFGNVMHSSGGYHRRYGGCELHAVASILGGCAAQEAIKLLTKQYVPVDNLFVFNAVKSETVSLKV